MMSSNSLPQGEPQQGADPAEPTSTGDYSSREAEGRERLGTNSYSSIRTRADSSGSLPAARSGSSASTISRCDSRASSASSSQGNRVSIISNEAGFLADLQEEVSEGDSDSSEENKGILFKPAEDFQVNAQALMEEGNCSHSTQVPHSTSTLEQKEDLDFILDKMFCHLETRFINNIKKLCSEARLGARTINCPMFTVNEYNACLQVRFDADHVSIGIAIMKGRNDRGLVWPFNMIVLFRLKNLSGGEHIVRMFRCDKNGSRIKEAVSRPKSDMNVAVGFPHFITRQHLCNGGFVRNDEMLLQCYLFRRDAKINQEPEYPSIISSQRV